MSLTVGSDKISHVPSVIDALTRRARRDGARPLLTWYDLSTGARTELSGVTLANWADKTANLLLELDVEAGDVVAMPLVTTDPGHWTTLALLTGAWQAGATVAADDDPEAVLTVVGPADPRVRSGASGDVLACSLHPLGLGLQGTLGPGVIDFSEDVRAQPDHFGGVPVDQGTTAWRDGSRSMSYAAVGEVEPSAERRLVRPTGPWETVRAALVAPLLGGGSSLVVVGEGDVARIAETERADA